MSSKRQSDQSPDSKRAKTDTDSKMVETVKFNVGGKHYEVSRALIDENCSETVLGKLVSDTWNDDPEETVFIDRDGDIFGHILNYLRYGSIELPTNIPRNMFDRELDYYGINYLGEGISVYGAAPTLVSFAQPVARAKKNLAEAQRKYDLFSLAMECQSYWCKAITASPMSRANFYVHRSNEKSFQCWSNLHSNGGNDRVLFDTYLAYFGLAVDIQKETQSFKILVEKKQKP